MANLIRIQKVLSDNGILSRRKAEAYIKEGRIQVNGRPAKIGHAVDVRKDIITVDGKPVQFMRKKQNIYIALNKPRGYVTTTSDELGRKCITELVSDLPQRVYPIGRLDKVSEGLILLTNDGDFANFIMHPSHHVSKTYRVTVRPDITEEQIIKLSSGVQIGEGEVTAPAQVHVLEKVPGRAVLQMSIGEGKNRQIRRMCEGVGLEIVRLKRVSIGPVKLGMLQPGKYRELTGAEVGALRNASKETINPDAPIKPKVIRGWNRPGTDGPRTGARFGPRPSGTGPRPSGTGPRPSGTGPRPSGTGARPSGTGPRPSGTGPRPSGTGARRPSPNRGARKNYDND